MTKSLRVLVLVTLLAALPGCKEESIGPMSDPKTPNIKVYALQIDKNDITLQALLNKASQGDALSEKKLAEMLSSGAVPRHPVSGRELEAAGIGIVFSSGDQILRLGAPQSKPSEVREVSLRKESVGSYDDIWGSMWCTFSGIPGWWTAHAAGGMSIYPSPPFDRVAFYFIFEETWPGVIGEAYSVESDQGGEFSAYLSLRCTTNGVNYYRMRIGYLVNHPYSWGWWTERGWSYGYAHMPITEDPGD